jgi:predicted lipoprotein with Yx(FWY)xxD motif
VALVAAGCGSSGNTSTATTNGARGSSATVSVANTGLGNILVDSQGRTLYLFAKDSGTKSACSGACATAWPPLRASGKPTAGGGAKASLLGTTPRSDGKPQVTYNGHPLYGYQGDSSSGDTNGQGSTGFGAPWYVLSATGSEITAASSTSGGSSY